MQKKLFARVLTSLIFFFHFSAFAGPIPEEFNAIPGAVHALAELLRQGVALDDIRYLDVGKRIKQISKSDAEVRKFLEYAYHVGSLHLDDFQADLDVISQRIAGEIDDRSHRPLTAQLVVYGYPQLVLKLADIPKEVVEAGTYATFHYEGADRQNTLSGKADAQIAAVEGKYKKVFDKQHAANQKESSYRTGVWRKFSAGVLAVLGVGVALFHNSLGIDDMKPTEMAAKTAGVFGALAGAFYTIYEWTGWLGRRANRHCQAADAECELAWDGLYELLPDLTDRTASASARERPRDPETEVNPRNLPALRSMLRQLLLDPSPERVANAQETGHRYLRNNHPDEAKLVLEKLDELRNRANKEAPKHAPAVVESVEIKKKLQRQVLIRQIGWTAFRFGGIGLVLWAVDSLLTAQFPNLPHVVTRAAFSVVVTMGIAKIGMLLFRPEKVEKVKEYSVSIQEDMLVSLRKLMEIDKSGKLVSQIALNGHKDPAQVILARLAIKVLAESPSGEVSQTFYRVLRYALAFGRTPDYLNDLVGQAALQHSNCLGALTAAVERAARPFRIPNPKGDPVLGP